MVQQRRRNQEPVEVTPDVLRWARRYRGLDLRSAADQLSITERQLEDIERGRESPILPLLNEMRKVYKQGIGVLLRHTVPLTPPRLLDFRTIEGRTPNLTPETLNHIRESQSVQDKLRELQAQAPELIPPADLPEAEGQDDPALVASMERLRFGVPIRSQKATSALSSSDDQFHFWRTVFQERGILIFSKSLKTENCRGFSLWIEDGPPVIVVSSQDSAAGRLFTLMHEYAHLMRRQSSMCIAGREAPGDNTEPWCNAFAASFLVPEDDLRTEVARKFPNLSRSQWNLSNVHALAVTYRVSDLAMAIRLKTLGVTNLVDDARRALFGQDKKRTGGPPGPNDPETSRRPYRRAGEFGYLAVNAFVTAARSGEMDAARAAQALRLKSIRELEESGRHADKFWRDRRFAR